MPAVVVTQGDRHATVPTPSRSPQRVSTPGWIAIGLLSIAVVGMGVSVRSGLDHDPRVRSALPAVRQGFDHEIAGGVGRAQEPLLGVTNWPLLLQLALLALFVVLLAGAVITSVRAGRVSNSLLLVGACCALTYLDPVANWATYSVYDPQLLHLPTSWPYASLAPVIEPPFLVLLGYPVYFVLPALLSSRLYRRVVLPRAGASSFPARHPLVSLALICCAVGVPIDIAVQLTVMRADIYSYSQYFGPAIGTVHLPLMTTVLDVLIMASAAILTWKDDSGRSTAQRLATRLRLGRRHPRLAELAAAVGVLSVGYMIGLAPWIGMRVANRVDSLATPWRYGEATIYDPDCQWQAAAGEEELARFSGIWSLGRGDDCPDPATPSAP